MAGGILNDFITGQLNSLTAIGGMSSAAFGLRNEAETTAIDLFGDSKKANGTRNKSRLTLPRLLGDGEHEKNILSDVL